MKRATIAGTFPTPKIGIINANSAKEGTVCSALVMPITIVAALGNGSRSHRSVQQQESLRAKPQRDIQMFETLVTNWRHIH